MKLNKFMVAAIALGFVSAANAANAANAAQDAGHGTIEFYGSIIDAPCSIAPGDDNQRIPMGQIANVALKDGGKSTPENFYIHLENCDASTLKTVTTTFTGPTSAGNADLLGITGTARGASLAITDGSGTLIKLGQPTAPQGIQDQTNILNFSAYLQGDMGADGKTAAEIVPGDFSTTTTFTLAYQ
ncbi:type 1 fimbrial protein [Serratia sp. JSRIV002]|uniref:fimbrial protein n=1 Tax=Serratia sp. JSRIV002 TaxID=2831894 RepID=UPI001CBB0FF0|nr:fimbrial protein [Serratia sp. JSRIV002]UAN52440.1 type 1 fimbrial protein [Serratia sp. JSRIV002]